MNFNKIALVSGLTLGLWIMIPRTSFAAVLIDASQVNGKPTLSSADPFFFGENNPSALGGPSTVTSIDPNKWEIRLIFAGGDFASFGGNNRGLDVLDPVTGKLLDSISFNYLTYSWSTDLVVFDAYLYTADASGNPASESARCPVLCQTAVYNGTNQLVMQGMSTAYTTFDVYLTGTSTVITSSVPEPLNILGATTGLALFGATSTGLKKKKAK